MVSVLAVATGYGFSLQVPRFVQNAHRYFMHGGIEWSEVVPVSAEEPISVRYPIVLPNWWELGKFDTNPHLCDVQRLANRFLHHVFHDVSLSPYLYWRMLISYSVNRVGPSVSMRSLWKNSA